VARNPVPRPHERRRSVFSTTQRNVLLYWLGTVVIGPAYFLCVFMLAAYLFPNAFDYTRQPDYVHWGWLQAPVPFLLLVFYSTVALLPIISTFLMPNWWLHGLRDRRAALVVSIVIVVVLYIHRPDIVGTIIGPVVVTWSIYAALRSLNHWRWRRGLPFLLLLLLCVGVFALQNRVDLSALVNVGASIWFLLSVCVCFFALPSLVQRTRENTGLMVLHLFFSLFLVLLVWAKSISPLWTFFFATVWLFVSLHPIRFLSRLVAGWRHATRRSRHDLLTNRSSTMIGARHWYNRLLSWIRRQANISNRPLVIGILILTGGVLIPSLLRTDETQPLELLAIALVGTSALVTIYISYILFRNQGRYVVSSFEVVPDARVRNTDDSRSNVDPELRAIANLTTHILVEELREISRLIKLRQVENLNLSDDNNGAFFVTSGIDQDFINKMQQAVSVDIQGNTRYGLGQLASLILRVLASVRVEGTVQRRSTQNVEIWVQVTYGGQNAAAVDQVIVPENSVTEIDERTIRPIAHKLAIKLLMELGRLSHLGSSPESLDALLRGLDATSKRDWWHAISHFRQALQYEETLQGSFGIGHYHLGSALLFQGDYTEGLAHLQTAEVDGPTSAETQYMIALALLTAYWSEIQSKPSIYHEIITRLQQAIEQKRNFAEAHQLIGIVHYRRGRLELRNATSGYRFSPEAKDSLHFFRLAEHHLRKAIRLYDQQIAAAFQRSQNGGQSHEDSSSVRQRITATHHLADALRMQRKNYEAETYYHDVIAVYPRNIRNLADLTKLYCLSGNWQQAETFLWRFAFNNDVAYWDADMCLHMGWVMMGGIADQDDGVLRFFDYIARSFFQNLPDDPALRHMRRYSDRKKQRIQEQLHILTTGLQFLDYALHQRPRYAAFDAQTNWWDPLNRVLCGFESGENLKNEDYSTQVVQHRNLRLTVDEMALETQADTPIALVIRVKCELDCSESEDKPSDIDVICNESVPLTNNVEEYPIKSIQLSTNQFGTITQITFALASRQAASPVYVHHLNSTAVSSVVEDNTTDRLVIERSAWQGNEGVLKKTKLDKHSVTEISIKEIHARVDKNCQLLDFRPTVDLTLLTATGSAKSKVLALLKSEYFAEKRLDLDNPALRAAQVQAWLALRLQTLGILDSIPPDSEHAVAIPASGWQSIVHRYLAYLDSSTDPFTREFYTTYCLFSQFQQQAIELQKLMDSDDHARSMGFPLVTATRLFSPASTVVIIP